MNKVAHYLQEHLVGEVLTSDDARDYFSTDNSIFKIRPSVIVYPRSENDIRKTARFTWQLAERNRPIPITARGSGTDLAGASLGAGIILALPAHMNRILELDGKTGIVTGEPGLNYGKLQQSLHTHGRFLPPFPASIEYSTIGGAVANNASGEKSYRYGDTKDYVRTLRLVLSNGEVIETGRLSKRELSRKMGLSTFEGEIYRALDTLIEENQNFIKDMQIKSIKSNTAGYNIWDVKTKKGFDLTPLIVGSQGTLGIVSEISFKTEIYTPGSTMIAVFLRDQAQAQDILIDINKLPKVPTSIEVVDDNLLTFVNNQNPNLLINVIKKPFPKLTLLIEIDDNSSKEQRKILKKLLKVLDKYNVEHKVETEEDKKDLMRKIRESVTTLATRSDNKARSLPIIDDGIVPLDRFNEYLEGVYDIFRRNKLPVALWGHGGSASLKTQPVLDLNQVGDRQKIFRILEEYYSLIIELGGSTSAGHGDGRLRAPYLQKLYGVEAYEIFSKIKNIFDPYGLLNPGVKIGVSIDDIKPLLRNEYSLGHLYDHVPRT